ncbi:MAG TPA: DUF169 domain-containing protein [Candidatus Omnitrophota bacterium]|nr:DUF169 domain-containing protein [Candidatus Omnitrophota bacterium]
MAPLTEEEMIADRLVAALGLTRPPVALAWAEIAPEGAALVDRAFTSACAFWVEAETRTIFATAEDHANCPVGAMVMGLPLAPEVQARLGELVVGMAGCGYLAASEAGAIPVRENVAPGVVYGPLAGFPVEPEIVLAWLVPAQAMLWAEAAGAVEWGGEATRQFTGRPACAAIPSALAADRPVLSFGCIGMRTFTGLPDDSLLGVIPGHHLTAFVHRLEETADANRQMAAFYHQARAALGVEI